MCMIHSKIFRLTAVTSCVWMCVCVCDLCGCAAECDLSSWHRFYSNRRRKGVVFGVMIMWCFFFVRARLQNTAPPAATTTNTHTHTHAHTEKLSRSRTCTNMCVGFRVRQHGWFRLHKHTEYGDSSSDKALERLASTYLARLLSLALCAKCASTICTRSIGVF